MNGRAYDPSIGRFMTVDIIVSNPKDGQTLNPHSYVSNNPLKYTDPSGYTQEDATTVSEGNESNETTEEYDEAVYQAAVEKIANEKCKSKCEVDKIPTASG